MHVVNESSIYIVRIYTYIHIHKNLIVYIFNCELKIITKNTKKEQKKTKKLEQNNYETVG